MLTLIRFIPLMGILLVVYNLLAVTATPESPLITRQFMEMTLPSGVLWKLTVGNMFVCVALLILFVELIKSTTASQKAMIEQSLSVIVFLVFLIQFLLWSPAGNTTFFLLTLIAFVESLGGFIIMTRVAGRDISIN